MLSLCCSQERSSVSHLSIKLNTFQISTGFENLGIAVIYQDSSVSWTVHIIPEASLHMTDGWEVGQGRQRPVLFLPLISCDFQGALQRSGVNVLVKGACGGTALSKIGCCTFHGSSSAHVALCSLLTGTWVSYVASLSFPLLLCKGERRNHSTHSLGFCKD